MVWPVILARLAPMIAKAAPAIARMGAGKAATAAGGRAAATGATRAAATRAGASGAARATAPAGGAVRAQATQRASAAGIAYTETNMATGVTQTFRGTPKAASAGASKTPNMAQMADMLGSAHGGGASGQAATPPQPPPIPPPVATGGAPQPEDRKPESVDKLGQSFKKLTGTAVKVTGVLGKTVLALVGFEQAIKWVSRRQVQQQFNEYGDISPGVAIAGVQIGVERLSRRASRGREVAPSYQRLSSAVSNREQMTNQISAKLETLSNNVLTAGTKVSAEIVEQLVTRLKLDALLGLANATMEGLLTWLGTMDIGEADMDKLRQPLDEFMKHLDKHAAPRNPPRIKP